MISRRLLLPAAAGLLTLAAPLARAADIGISFQFSGSTNGQPLLATESTGADALANWNVLTTNSASGATGYSDSNGLAAAGLTLTYTSNYGAVIDGGGIYQSPTTSETKLYSSNIESPYAPNANGPVTDNNRLGIDVTNIPYATYNVYVYTRDGNQGSTIYESATDFFTASGNIATSSISAAYSDAPDYTDFTAGDNYVEFTGLTSSNLFLLDATDFSGGAPGGTPGFSGFQIVSAAAPVPEPASIGLLAVASVGFLSRRRVK